MENKFTVELLKIVEEFSLEKLYLPKNESELIISNSDINRPGLQLGGFYELFDNSRIQIVGKSEQSYIKSFPKEKYEELVDNFFALKPAAVIISRGLNFEGFVEAAEKYDVPLLRTEQSTSEFMAALIASLHLSLAPRITRHGVLVEVYGEGILLLGESGVGKSETAIELVKRGHRLIADDAVEIKKVSAKTLVGSAPEIIRHYVELRGIGLIDVRRIFGMGAVKETEKIDLVINLENWIEGKMYDRLGLDEEKVDILGNQIPAITIPVKPGRNLAIILEIAAMNNRQKKMGYNTAEEFNKRLMEQIGNAL